jgi:NAD(P)-dependent dehydrogenase (short-subunit alcohol dehydrogenase family)
LNEAQEVSSAAGVALITGAAGGIGRAIVDSLAAHGWIVVAADVNADVLERSKFVEPELVHRVVMDVTSTTSVEAAFSEAERHFGTVTGLVNNAGFAVQTPFADITEAEWSSEFDVMVGGAIRTMHRALPAMASVGGAAIVNVSSVNGLGFYGHPTYSACKAALNSLTQSVAALAGRAGTRVNAVAPGTVLTPIWGENPSDATAPLMPYVPLGKLATPEDIASVVRFLLSCDAGHLTGAVIPVDGGLTTGILPMANHISGRR